MISGLLIANPMLFFSYIKKKNHIWSHWVFVAALELSPVAVPRLLIVVASLVVDHRL